MKNVISIFSAFILISSSICGQSLVITDSATTTSVCFNDGTITMSASGGTGSYTYTVISGPAYPNITYPIVLPAHDSVFLTMPAGEYTIKVTDGAGNTATATATVAGTYTFPVLTNVPDTVYSTCITVTVQGGNPPYQYARSTTGTNTGFGPYQSSSSFCPLCNGPNWIRVMDACSNIYTTNKVYVEVPVPQYTVTDQTVGSIDSIHVTVTTAGAPPYTYHLTSGSISITNSTGVFGIPVRCPPDTITVTDSCGRTWRDILDIHHLTAGVVSVCGSGSAVITIDSAAIGPYTITGSNGTLVTNQNVISFNTLPPDSHYHFTITDACGNIDNVAATCLDTNFFYIVCPFDSSIHIVANPVHFCYPVVVTCMSCSPVQVDTLLSTPARLFTGIQIGVPYQIRIQDQCGFNYVTADTPQLQPVTVADSIISCRDFSLYAIPRTLSPPVHFSVYYQGSLVDSVTSNDHTFYHMSAGTYQITATQPRCAGSPLTVTIPTLGGSCVVPMFDSGCIPSYAIIQYLTDYTETYSLVDTLTGASYTQIHPSPYLNAILFYNVPVGAYNLVSDSGCSTPFSLPAFGHYTISAYSTRECTGSALIRASYTPVISSCNTSQAAYFTLLKNNQYIANWNSINGAGAHWVVNDTGYYVVRLYMTNPSIFGIFTTEDTMCALDTALVYVSNVATPNLSSPLIDVCGHVHTNIPYTIFGGTPPYTLQILGYPTQTVDSTSGIFPNVLPGTYTMIVSDSCGISRSFSVAIIDTCSPACTVHSQFSISDTVMCTHASASLLNQSTGATHYRWDINGSLYTYVPDTSFYAAGAGVYTITLFAYIGVCTDTAQRNITVQDTLHSFGRRDTSLCAPFAVVLNSHNISTLWSTGITDSTITVTAPGLYQETLSNICGSATDTVNVTQYPDIAGLDMTDSRDYLCESVRDSVMITASIDSSGQRPVTFTWSTGISDSSAYSSGIIVYEAGTYQVVAYNGYCPVMKTISIDSMSCDSECISGVAIPDIFSPNGDMKNDTFYILHLCDIVPFDMHIYDRWGELVFESPDINKGWDGNYRGSPQPQGVYWLWLALTLSDGKTVFKSGTVTLVR